MKLLRFVLTLAYAGVILYLSTMPSTGETPFPHFDKAAHLVVYAGFGALLAWVLRLTILRGRRGILIAAAGIATLYGVAMEGVQMLLPHRTPETADLIVNAIGAFGGAALLVAVARCYRRRQEG